MRVDWHGAGLVRQEDGHGHETRASAATFGVESLTG